MKNVGHLVVTYDLRELIKIVEQSVFSLVYLKDI